MTVAPERAASDLHVSVPLKQACTDRKSMRASPSFFIYMLSADMKWAVVRPFAALGDYDLVPLLVWHQNQSHLFNSSKIPSHHTL